MERFKDISTEELEKRVKTRQAQIEKFVNFVKAITPELGVVERHEESSYTNTRAKLFGFEHFSFFSSTDQCMMGGNTFEVWYHPGEERIDIDESKPVLSVCYQDDIGKCEVKAFSPSDEWQAALTHLIEHKDEFIAQREKAEKDRKEQFRSQTEEDRKRNKLLADAERLKL